MLIMIISGVWELETGIDYPVNGGRLKRKWCVSEGKGVEDCIFDLKKKGKLREHMKILGIESYKIIKIVCIIHRYTSLV